MAEGEKAAFTVLSVVLTMTAARALTVRRARMR